MFIWIESPSTEYDWSRHTDAFENLGLAGFKRDHLILGDLCALEAACKNTNLSNRARAYFRSVTTKYPTLGGIRREVVPVIARPDVLAPFTSDSKETIVPLDHFANEKSTGQVTIICEHLYDCKIICEIGRCVLRAKRLAGLASISMAKVPGGGGGIHLALTDRMADPFSWGVCIVDSDRAHAAGKLGNTARTCQIAYFAEPSSHWRWELHILNARELENIIPIEAWAECLGSSGFALTDTIHERAWNVLGFLDSKQGDSLCRILKTPKSDSGRKLIEDAITSVSRHLHPVYLQCASTKECVGDNRCVLVAADSSRLRKLSDWIDRQGNQLLSKVSFSGRPIEDIAQLVMSRGLAANISCV